MMKNREIPKRYALIVAGGSGNRMNSTVPKQFLLLNGLPVLMHTLRRFHQYDGSIEIVLVLPLLQFEPWKELCSQHSFSLPYILVAGGSVRFESVKNGLDAISGEGLVAIHDGVRPLVSFETLDRCFDTALREGNALPVLPVVESLRKREGNLNEPVDRSKYYGVQTPQTFWLSRIKKAYQQPYDPAYTDDAMVLERMGEAIHLVQGNRENIKITHPEDLIVAEALIK
jgi:2-C-methyl-D-erythritol 4-phosphate cytidylyltransferase